MRVLSAIVFHFPIASKIPIIVATVYELSDFGIFQKGTIRELILFTSREIVGRTNQGSRLSVRHQFEDSNVEFQCHSYVNFKNIACAVVTDGSYEPKYAHELISQIITATVNSLTTDKIKMLTNDSSLDVPDIITLIKKYQKPEEKDVVAKINRDIEDTKDIVRRNIDQLLENGESLESLAAKSKDLSNSSKVFVKRAKKLKGCGCSIM